MCVDERRSLNSPFYWLHACMCMLSFQWSWTLCDPMDCSLPGSSIHGILQARILEWVAMLSSRGSSQPRDPTSIFCISCIGRWILYHLEAHLTMVGDQIFCLIQDFNRMNETHPLDESNLLYCLYIQRLISSRNTFTDTLREMFDQICGHPMAQSN